MSKNVQIHKSIKNRHIQVLKQSFWKDTLRKQANIFTLDSKIKCNTTHKQLKTKYLQALCYKHFSNSLILLWLSCFCTALRHLNQKSSPLYKEADKNSINNLVRNFALLSKILLISIFWCSQLCVSVYEGPNTIRAQAPLLNYTGEPPKDNCLVTIA